MLYNKKKTRKVKRPKIGRENYYDTDRLNTIIKNCLGLTHENPETIRIKLVGTYPTPRYRISILARSKTPRQVRQRDGRIAEVFAGQYVSQTWFVTKKNADDFSFEPPLEGYSLDVETN